MNNELYHWGFRRGEEAKNHKYSRRELVGTRQGRNVYRYFYDNVKNKVNNIQRQMSQTKQAQNQSQSRDNIGFVVPISVNTVDKIRAPIFDKIYDTLLSKVGETRAYKKGKEKTEALLNESKNPQIEKDKEHKYVGRVKKADGTYRYFYDQKSLEHYYKSHGDNVERQLMQDYGLKDESVTPEQDVAEINEKYETHNMVEMYYSMNCYSASLAYDLRRRGFDVDAIPDSNGESALTVMDFYENGRRDTHKNKTPRDPDEYCKEMLEEMKNEGDGARGIIMVVWKGGAGAHAMAWEVVGDEVIIRDCQTTKQHYSAEQHSEEYEAEVQSGERAKVMRNFDQDNMYIEELIQVSDVANSREAVRWLRTDDKKIDESAIKFVRKDKKELR